MKNPEPGRKKNRLKAYLFLIVGGALAGYGLFGYLSDYFFMKNAATVTGTVTEMYMVYDGKKKFDHETGKKSKSFTSIVQYAVDGKKYEHTVKGSQSPEFAEGDQIKIYYSPHNPTDAKIKKENTLLQLALSGMGGVLFLFGMAMFFAKEKVTDKKRSKAGH